jgi:hypothetical protein
MATATARRFDVGSSTQPIFQLIIATLPLFFLLVWFIFDARRQLKSSCYDGNAYYNNEEAYANYEEECGKLIPLEEFVYVFLVIYSICMLLVCYIQIFIQYRHALVYEYLNQGETVIGTVYYRSNKYNLTLTSYGHVIYEHDSKRIRRNVQIFERYTREFAAILRLPDLPLSGQPKVDLEIDRDSFERNKPRMKILLWYVWAWIIFCFFAPLYIIRNLQIIRSKNGIETKGNLFLLFCMMYFLIIPAVAVTGTYIMWIFYKRWMTAQHKVLDDDERADEPRSGCCFDDHDCESVQITDYVKMTQTEMSSNTRNCL